MSSAFDDDFEGDAGNDTVNGCSGNEAAYGGGDDDLFSVFAGMILFMATRATI